MLQQEQENLSTSTWSVAHAVRVSRSSVWRILYEHDIHPFHLCVQALLPDDYAPCITFAHWYLGMFTTDPFFPAKVLFSDEASFTREGIFQPHNAHMWVQPTCKTLCKTDSIFGQCWSGTIGYHPIRSYLLPFHLTEYLLITAEMFIITKMSIIAH